MEGLTGLLIVMGAMAGAEKKLGLLPRLLGIVLSGSVCRPSESMGPAVLEALGCCGAIFLTLSLFLPWWSVAPPKYNLYQLVVCPTPKENKESKSNSFCNPSSCPALPELVLSCLVA